MRDIYSGREVQLYDERTEGDSGKYSFFPFLQKEMGITDDTCSKLE